jgi:putative transcriptional regulator
VRPEEARAWQWYERSRMKKKGLEEFLASMEQESQSAIARRVSARTPVITALSVKALRARTKLSQSDFAALLGVEVSTLRNWEQGRRVPTGPARALLRAIRNDPQNVIRALARAA